MDPNGGFAPVPSFTIDEDDENPPHVGSSLDSSNPNSDFASKSQFYAEQTFPKLAVWFALFLAGLFLGLTVGLSLNMAPVSTFPFNSASDPDSSSDNSPIYVSSPSGLSLLNTVSSLPSLLQTAFHSPVQINQANCGIATTASLLNTLLHPPLSPSSPSSPPPLTVPPTTSYSPYPYYTQSSIRSTPCTSQILNTPPFSTFDGVETPPYGMTLTQISDLLSCHIPPSYTSKILTTSTPYPLFTKTLNSCFSNPTCRVGVNFLRTSLSQPGGGHWSPLLKTHSNYYALIDVAKYKEPYIYFITPEMLYNSIDNVDDCGVWDWPSAQDGLSEEEREGGVDENVKEKLGCIPHKRGIVMVYE
ncbi:hypothetical protein TrVE_jg11825 [Triparma verrucosa]|uniref:glutathione gamma-glutamylcysteinyltransferase n=1 Tax=Triparma verrucosa TaxID=1606542 RepID=A0A9W7B6A7_9STRA|nr:hypothetical protein TrVE_jg11825 [Triparma verrucosa]